MSSKHFSSVAEVRFWVWFLSLAVLKMALGLKRLKSSRRKMVAIPRGVAVDVWSLASGQRIRRLEGLSGKGIVTLAFSPEDKTLVAGEQKGMLHFWDLATGTAVYRHLTDQGRIRLLSFSGDGKVLVSGDGRGLKSWDPSSWKLMNQLGLPDSTHPKAISPSGSLLAAGGEPTELIRGPSQIWNLRTMKLMHTLKADADVPAAAFSPMVATSEYDVPQQTNAISL